MQEACNALIFCGQFPVDTQLRPTTELARKLWASGCGSQDWKVYEYPTGRNRDRVRDYQLRCQKCGQTTSVTILAKGVPLEEAK